MQSFRRCTASAPQARCWKAVLTGQNLPSDFEVQAAQSPLLRQYDPSRAASLARPASLYGSDLTNAFVPDVR